MALWYNLIIKIGVKFMPKTNSKGQALVEFLLILPIFLFILLAVVDFGRIFVTRSNLESLSSEAVKLYEKDSNYDTVNKELKEISSDEFVLSIDKNGNKVKIVVQRDVSIMTPGLQQVLGKVYKASSERVILDE